VPVEVLARALGFADPAAAAAAVAAVAPAYFPGSPAETQAAADAGVATLVELSGPDGAGDGTGLERVVARIALLVQTCDATAGLIGNALHVLQDAGGVTWSTDALLAEVLRHRSPLKRMRRLTAAPAPEYGLAAGEPVVCDIDAANRDPEVFERPDVFDPDRPQRPSLTFGDGIRPCPGQAEAVALAAGVVDAVRGRALWLAGEDVELEPSPALRIPARLLVALLPEA
jgi:cytochrome P450